MSTIRQSLSPKKYIETKARSLPIHKCYVNKDWQESMIANVFISRRHSNGNLTTGIYLIDLLCLGIKDTFYFFNEPEKLLREKLDSSGDLFDEIDYNIAHNIVYAGHDFAMEFDIKPHKEFSTTAFILEEDDDAIPIEEIHCGDEEGNPYLMVDSTYPYTAVLQKLKKNAGKGNYTFTLVDDEDFEEDENDEEEDVFLCDIEDGMLDFDNIKEINLGELLNREEIDRKTLPDQVIIEAELAIRLLLDNEPDAIQDEDEMEENPEFRTYEDIEVSSLALMEKDEALAQLIFESLKAIADMDERELQNTEYIKLLEKYNGNEYAIFMILQMMPIDLFTDDGNWFQNNFSSLPAISQLFYTALVLLLDKETEPQQQFILNAPALSQAFITPTNFLVFHHTLFWLIQSLFGIQQNDKEKILKYYGFISLVGIGGALKSFYALKLRDWIMDYLNGDKKQFGGLRAV